VLARLARIEQGTLTLHEGGRTHALGEGREDAPRAELVVHDPRFWSALALRGGIGAGEAYARGWWSSPAATEVVRLFVRNREALEGVERGLARLSRPLLRMYHAARRNTLAGSRDNIAAHYDLSNEFFALFLDDTMTYSCGIFESPAATLREASLAKIERLCRKLELGPEDQLLEIGTGWGQLAIHAAREHGCCVTTTTISREQRELAEERVRAAGLQDRVTVLFEDYRRLGERPERYDKLVSVEMIEAVGHRYYDEFFACCAGLLKDDGLMALQAITIADQHFESAARSVDFIQRHVFPGSCIPSVTALLGAATRASDLRVTHLESIGHHYVRTLATWRGNLRAHRAEALALGLDDDFLRLFDFYFCYCEGGFAERHIDDVQLLLARPGSRVPAPLPSLD
jgi:cyclopropane-fatty-acyl-phospholipid synthase